MVRLSSSSLCSNWMSLVQPAPPPSPQPPVAIYRSKSPRNGVVQQHQLQTSLIMCAASKSSGFSLNSIFKKCGTCEGQGAVECSGCKGSGKNKKNGNIFERWKCYDCQGFGLRSCPACGKGGLTPEQRGER